MYRWTHTELARLQPNGNGNGPKTDDDEKVQKQSDQDDADSTVIMASEERGESFTTVKNKLLLCETATKISNSDTENDSEPNQIAPDDPIENGEKRLGSETENGGDGTNGHLKNGESLKQDCDKVEISIVEPSTFAEISTQTDDTMLSELNEKKSEVVTMSMPPPPPPPPPPPSPLPSICVVPPASDETDNSSVNETPVVEQMPITPQQNNSQINISSTKLSSASSFCPPPPPPMNGVPGPPPLPLPTGNMWFKSDSKFSHSVCHFEWKFIQF